MDKEKLTEVDGSVDLKVDGQKELKSFSNNGD